MMMMMMMISIFSRVSFCDGSFYDDSLLRPLSSRTEHSRLVVHHCRNSSVLSLLIVLLALFLYRTYHFVMVYFLNYTEASPSGRAIQGVGLWPLAC